MFSHRHRVLLLKTGFRYGDRPALFARARLYPDRIELTDWSPRGQASRMIELSNVERVEWSGSGEEGEVVLVLNEGERVPLRLKNAPRWRQILDQCLKWGSDDRRHALNLPLKDHVAYTTSMS